MVRIFALLIALVLIHPAQAATDRVALIMGNAAYTKLSSLRNPVNDARLMAQTLEASGFAVTIVLDADQKTMKRAMLKFTRTLRKTRASGLFYYAGHGVQVGGENYLVPLGVDLQDESEIEIETINVNAFVRTMENTQNPINIVILDACRNNPFPASSRSTSRGLAEVRAPKGTFLAYSTAPGQVSDDGDAGDGNSPYTTALASAMSQPGLTIEQVFKRTRVAVLEVTDEAQIPWENSSITGEFFFLPGSSGAGSQSVSAELALWNAIKNSNDKAVFEDYLRQFPKGVFAAAARSRIRDVKAVQIAKLSNPGSSVVPKSNSSTPDSIRACSRLIAEADSFFPSDYAPGIGLEDLQAREFISSCNIALASSPDSPDIKFQLARAHYQSKQYKTALKYYQQAADSGHSLAQAYFGVVYLVKDAGVKDYKKALFWFRKSAEQEEAYGQVMLGAAYRNGWGVSKNYSKAASWFRKAADQGMARGQKDLAYMYYVGSGVSKSLKKAAVYTRLAAEQGYPGAQFNLGVVLEFGHGTRRNSTEAAKWFYASLESKHEAALTYTSWKSATLKALQRLLKNDGLYTSTIDGRNGPGTRRAMKSLCDCG